MDKVSMELALMAARASGDREAVKMITSVMPGKKVHSSESAGFDFGTDLGSAVSVESKLMTVDSSTMRDEMHLPPDNLFQALLNDIKASITSNVNQSEAAHSASLGSLIEGVASESRMVVINGATGEVIEQEDLPPEVRAIIAAMGRSQSHGDNEEQEEVGVDYDDFDFTTTSDAGSTKH